MLKPDKRRHVRVVFTRTVKVIINSQVLGSYSARNLSLGGLFVEGLTEVSTGETCTIRLHETGLQSSLILTFEAKIVRKEPDGAAIEFTDMEDDSFMFLQTMVLYASDDPVGIAKDFLEDFSQLAHNEKPRSACS